MFCPNCGKKIPDQAKFCGYCDAPVGENPVDRDYLRWLYTAFTRATDRVYLLNFDARFFPD